MAAQATIRRAILQDADLRRRGIGRALLDAVRLAGAEIGIKTMALDVWSFNEEARAFFRNYGLTPFNERLWNVQE